VITLSSSVDRPGKTPARSLSILVAGGMLLALIGLIPCLAISAWAYDAPSEEWGPSGPPESGGQELPALDLSGQGGAATGGDGGEGLDKDLPPVGARGGDQVNALNDLPDDSAVESADALLGEQAGTPPNAGGAVVERLPADQAPLTYAPRTLVSLTDVPLMPFTKEDEVVVDSPTADDENDKDDDGKDDDGKAPPPPPTLAEQRDQAAERFDQELADVQAAQSSVDAVGNIGNPQVTQVVNDNLVQQSEELTEAREEFFPVDVQAAMEKLGTADAPAAYQTAHASWAAAKKQEWGLRAQIAKADATINDATASQQARDDAAIAKATLQQTLDAIWAPAEQQYTWMQSLEKVPDLAGQAGTEAGQLREAVGDVREAGDRADSVRATMDNFVGDNYKFEPALDEAERDRTMAAARRERELREVLAATEAARLAYVTGSPGLKTAPGLDEHGLPITRGEDGEGVPVGWTIAKSSQPTDPHSGGQVTEPIPGLAGYTPLREDVSMPIRVYSPGSPVPFAQGGPPTTLPLPAAPTDAVLPVQPAQVKLADGMIVRNFGPPPAGHVIPVRGVDDLNPLPGSAYRSTNQVAPGTPVMVKAYTPLAPGERDTSRDIDAVAGEPVSIVAPLTLPASSGGPAREKTLMRMDVSYPVLIDEANERESYVWLSWERVGDKLFSLTPESEDAARENGLEVPQFAYVVTDANGKPVTTLVDGQHVEQMELKLPARYGMWYQFQHGDAVPQFP
jgi:hypothetical protein